MTKRQPKKIKALPEGEAISNRIMLVLYLTCVRRPRLFIVLRSLCKSLRDDRELEVDFIKSRKFKLKLDMFSRKDVESFEKYFLPYACNALLRNVNSLSEKSMMRYILSINNILITEIQYHKAEDPLARYVVHWNPQWIEIDSEHPFSKLIIHLMSHEKYGVNFRNNFPLRYFCIIGDTSIVKALLKRPEVSPDDKDNAAIISASRRGHLEIVRALMKDKRVNPAARHNEAITSAYHNRHQDVMDLLREDERVDDKDCWSEPDTNFYGEGEEEDDDEYWG
jgi:Ankyrin repeats (3 copies)